MEDGEDGEDEVVVSPAESVSSPRPSHSLSLRDLGWGVEGALPRDRCTGGAEEKRRGL